MGDFVIFKQLLEEMYYRDNNPRSTGRRAERIARERDRYLIELREQTPPKRLYIEPKPTHNRVNGFMRVIDEFQAINNKVEISQEVIERVRATLDTTGDVSKIDVRNTLKKLKLSKYYGSTHYIHHILTNIPKNDISEYRDRLVNSFRDISSRYDKRNFFNTQLVLYRLLEHHGLEFDQSEFFIPKSVKNKRISF